MKTPVTVSPDLKHVSTSLSECFHLTVHMQDRRFTRLTNAFSKKIDDHAPSTVIRVFGYNFAWRHQALDVSPAMEAGLTDYVWSLAEVVVLANRCETERAAVLGPRASGLSPVR